MIKTIIPSSVAGIVAANPSKSAMQRAVAAAMLAHGKSIIRNPCLSQDCTAALHVAECLGAAIVKFKDHIEINGSGVNPQGTQINCGESGLGIRMFTPLAALSGISIIITGEGSLAARPMQFFEEVFPKLGVFCQTNQGRLPLCIRGPLQPVDIEVDGSLSSQFLTGLLMAYGAVADQAVITVRNLKSKPYIGLTLQLMAHFGIQVRNDGYQQFIFEGRQFYHPAEYTVEGDWSGAAFLLVLGALAGQVTVNRLNMDSAQSDMAILQALKQSGAVMEFEKDRVTISSAPLRAFTLDATDCPDLFPPLVALAAHCAGVSTIKGVSRLAYKESDRGTALRQEFAKLGISIELQGDLMKITGAPVCAALVNSHHDHRIAMACAVTAMVANGPVIIEDAEAVNKSYPEFWDHLESLTK